MNNNRVQIDFGNVVGKIGRELRESNHRLDQRFRIAWVLPAEPIE